MCYKVDRHEHLAAMCADKLKDVPPFIADFFVRFKSMATANADWGYIRDLLQWLIDNDYITQDNISSITTEDMNKVSDTQVVKYLSGLNLGLYGKKNSLQSINTKKNVFGSFWNYLFINHYVDDNIIRKIPSHLYKSEVTQTEVIIPTDEQVENFIRRLHDGNGNEFNIVRNLTIVKLIMGTGIRSEELINMDVKDLHLDEDKPYVMVLGKGKKEVYDKVFISKEGKKQLEEYLNQRKIFLREHKFESNALFISNDKRRMSKTAMSSFFNRYSDGEINPHMLRHWVGTKLYERTNDIVLVQRQLRHSSLETTARYYVHLDEDKIADAIMDL